MEENEAGEEDLKETVARLLKPLVGHYIRAGDYEKAINVLRDLVALVPEDEGAWHRLACCCGRRGRWEEALSAREKLVELAPHEPVAHYNLGVACRECDRLYDAISSWQTAVRLKPDYANAWNNLCLAYMVTGHAKKARRALERLGEFEPDTALALRRRFSDLLG